MFLIQEREREALTIDFNLIWWHPLKIKGIYIFRTESGITLFSRRMLDVQEDLVSAFISALKDFFNSFSLGGLCTFASENYIFYLASEYNVSTALIVDKNDKSERYFNIAYKISRNFYYKYKHYLEKDISLQIPNIEEFDSVVNEVLASTQESEQQKELIKLYKFNKSEELQSFIFESESQLFNLPLFVAVNSVTRKIFVVENNEANISNRVLYLTNKAVSSLNQMDYKSKFKIRNISDSWDFERIILEISKILKDEPILIYNEGS